jgi:phosphotransferase system  glucose/maltose/N-acetylglucosamine-specific IIC component
LPIPLADSAELAIFYSGIGHLLLQYTEMRFGGFFSGGFTTMAVINPPEKKLAKHICVHYVH